MSWGKCLLQIHFLHCQKANISFNYYSALLFILLSKYIFFRYWDLQILSNSKQIIKIEIKNKRRENKNYFRFVTTYNILYNFWMTCNVCNSYFSFDNKMNLNIFLPMKQNISAIGNKLHFTKLTKFRDLVKLLFNIFETFELLKNLTNSLQIVLLCGL